jgi:hypothetical protein
MTPYYQRMFDPKGFRDKQLALAQSFRTDSPTSFVEKGEKYTLTPNWDQKRKLEAQMSPEALARDKALEARTGQIANLSFGYVSPSGKRFSGTFLGDGNYGGFGGATPTSRGGPQPAAGMAADIAMGQAPTLSDKPSPYSGFGFGSPNLGMGDYTPPITEQTPKFGLEGSSLTSPLAGPSPNISFPTQEEEILNPYGLRNYY